jgi:hypothetical protein
VAQIAKVGYTHEALIDAIIGNPGAKQREYAQMFGYTESWISQIMSSDSFKARLDARRKAVIDPVLIQNVEERMEGVMSQALDVIAEKLEAGRSPELALRALDISSRALGYGARDRNAANVNVSFVVALPQKAQSSEQWKAENDPRIVGVQNKQVGAEHSRTLPVPATIDLDTILA